MSHGDEMRAPDIFEAQLFSTNAALNAAIHGSKACWSALHSASGQQDCRAGAHGHGGHRGIHVICWRPGAYVRVSGPNTAAEMLQSRGVGVARDAAGRSRVGVPLLGQVVGSVGLWVCGFLLV